MWTKKRRVKVIAASFLTLGLTVPATAAVFSDNIFSQGTFTRAEFNMQGQVSRVNSTTGATEWTGWADHNTTPAVMTASTVRLAPGTSTYPSIQLRLDDSTRSNATVTMSNPVAIGGTNALWTSPHLTYRARLVAAGVTCNSAVFTSSTGSALVGTAQRFDATVSPLPTFELTGASTPGANVAQHVCFEIALSSDVRTGTPTANGMPVTPEWTFSARSA